MRSRERRTVFRSAVTKTLVPIDVSSQVTFGYDLLDILPSEECRAGRFLRKTLPYLFRAYRQELGYESISLNDAVAFEAVLHPELFDVELAAVDVELAGELTTGATVFDRRRQARVAHERGRGDESRYAAVRDCILRGIATAGAASHS